MFDKNIMIWKIYKILIETQQKTNVEKNKILIDKFAGTWYNYVYSTIFLIITIKKSATTLKIEKLLGVYVYFDQYKPKYKIESQEVV